MRQIDIGAAQAPLSDSERVDLDKGVRKHDYATEKSVIDKAMAEHPGSFELLVMAGRLAYLEKHPDDSAVALERADHIKPLAETDRITLALAYAFEKKPAQARAQLQQLMKVAPRNPEYRYLLGRVEVQNQQLEPAVADFSKAIELDPDMVRAYEDLGQAQENLGLVEASRKTYEAGALRNREKMHWEWSPLDLGVVELKAGELDGAQKLFGEALTYNPRFGWAHYYMGQLFQQRGDHTKAVQEYQEAVVDQPTLRQAWLALGREFTREGRTAEADKSLAIFKTLESEDNARQGKKN
ncbi:MAG: tetratricopeptide repeat protein [Bryobacteraceae bacterium]